VTLVAWLIFGGAMLGMAWFPWCCCDIADPPPCNKCSADSTTVAVTVSGISNGVVCSNCSWWNATFILTRTASNSCLWTKWGNWPCSGGSPAQYYVGAFATTDLATHRIWQASIQNIYASGGTAHLEYGRNKYDSGSASAMDCTATRTTTNDINVTDQGCAGYATMTVTINP
jgi:hypothetical protein